MHDSPSKSQDESRFRVLTFTGTVPEFLEWRRGFLNLAAQCERPLSLDDVYAWELTASIARHPAGKGLRPGDSS